MTSTSVNGLNDWLAAWAVAESDGDTAVLEQLLHPQFTAVGPFGFVLDRDAWVKRYADGLEYTSFTFTQDVDTREIGGTAYVVGTQEQKGSYQGRPTDGSFRATLVLHGGPQWQLVGLHLSMRTPPQPPARPGN